MDVLPGIYRGTVEVVDDPEKRKRYRVRVDVVHPPEIPAENIPWAESSMFAGHLFGDFEAFLAGDKVWVMFENGDRQYPVIMGGILAEKAGTDLPTELVSDYKTTQERWMRMDRAGNFILMSPLPDERGIVLQSGKTRISLLDNGSRIAIDSDSLVEVRAPRVEVNCEIRDATTTGDTSCTVRADILHAEVAKVATVKCEDTVNIRSKNTINIGRYEDELAIPYLTDTVDMRAEVLIKQDSEGTRDIDTKGAVTDDTEDTHLIHAEKTLDLQGDEGATLESKDKNVNVTAKEDLIVQVGTNETRNTDGDYRQQIDGDESRTVDGDLTSRVKGSVTVTVDGNCTIDVGGNAVIDADGNVEVTAGGTGKLEASGSLTVKAGGALTLEGATVAVKSSGALTLDGAVVTMTASGLCTIGGALIAIG